MPGPWESTPSRAGTALGWLLGLACLAYLLALPPTLHMADEGYLLHTAKRVLHGEALYRDVFDFVTPGSFYSYALAFAVGGTTLTSARVLTALLNALAATCTYFLALQVASAAEALLAGLLVVVVCVPVWNMASHHWLATSLGLATAAVLLAERWRGSSRARPAAAGALAGLVVCSDQARGLWLVLWLATAVPALALARAAPGRGQRCAREVAWAAIGGAAVCSAVLGYAVWRSSLGELVYATYTFVVTAYYNQHVGRAGWSGAGPAADGLRYTWPWLLYAIPVLLALEAVALRDAIRQSGLHAQVVRASLLLLAVLMTAAILYFPDFVHVAIVAPFSFVVLAGLVHRARTRSALARRGGVGVAFRVAWVALVALVGVKAWRNAALAWQDNPVLTETAFGTIAGPAFQADALRELRPWLRDAAASPRLYAYPGDAWLYLVLPADNPTPFASLWLRVHTPEQMETAKQRLAREPTTPVLVNTFWVKRDDPFVAYVQANYQDVGGVGRLHRLFLAKPPPSPPDRPAGP
jgi:hypothetical protein